jgi:hypothetical protein
LLENENNNSILSLNPTMENDTNCLLATYRLIESNISKFEVKFRTLEGKSGNLTCYVVPNVSPKTSQVFKVPIKSLSLHEKTNEVWVVFNWIDNTFSLGNRFEFSAFKSYHFWGTVFEK